MSTHLRPTRRWRGPIVTLILAGSLLASGRAANAETAALAFATPDPLAVSAAGVVPAAPAVPVTADADPGSSATVEPDQRAAGVEWVDGGDDSPCLNDDNGRALTSLPSEKWCTPIVGCYQDDVGKYVYPSRKTGIWQGDPSQVRYADEVATTVRPTVPPTTRPTVPPTTTPAPATTAPPKTGISATPGATTPTPAPGTPDPAKPGETVPLDPNAPKVDDPAKADGSTTSTTKAKADEKKEQEKKEKAKGAADAGDESASGGGSASGNETAGGPIDVTSDDGSGSGSGPSLAGLLVLVAIVGAGTGGVVWQRRRSHSTDATGA